MTTWALGLKPEPVTSFLEEGGGHWKNQLGCGRLYFMLVRSLAVGITSLALSET